MSIGIHGALSLAYKCLNRKDFAGAKLRANEVVARLDAIAPADRELWSELAPELRNPDALAFCILGAAETGLGEYDLAEKHLGVAISADPSNPLPYEKMALLHKHLGNTIKSELWFEESVRITSENAAINKIMTSIFD